MSKLPEITIVTDTREQMPLEFDCENVVGTLKTGDYSVLGYEDSICFERKSLADLVGTCDYKNRDRFKRELKRMRDGFRFYCILIEGWESEIVPHCEKLYKTQWRAFSAKKRRGFKGRPPKRPEVRSLGVMGSLKSWRSTYNAHFYFTGSRERSAELIKEMAQYFVNAELRYGFLVKDQKPFDHAATRRGIEPNERNQS